MGERARLSWNRDDEGIITIYATSEGRIAEVADLWIKPLMDRLGISRSAAKGMQERFAETFTASWNERQCDDAAGWECPIGVAGCMSDCGDYGCGN